MSDLVDGIIIGFFATIVVWTIFIGDGSKPR
jgi:hypothetical protein